MKTSFKSIILLLVVGSMFACNDMNESIDKFMENGERLYMGKVDSVKTFAGQNRFMVSFFLKDPRVDALTIFWNQKGDSIVLPIAAHSPDSLFKVSVGGGTFPEGNAVLQFIAKSKSKYQSMTVEGSVNVYGNSYQEKLISRYYNKVANNAYNSTRNTVNVYFGTAANQSEIGVSMRFFNKKLGAEKDTLISAASIAAANNISKGGLGYMVIPNIEYDKAAKPLTYRTLYLPEPTAIDTFYSKRDTIQTLKIQ